MPNVLLRSNPVSDMWLVQSSNKVKFIIAETWNVVTFLELWWICSSSTLALVKCCVINSFSSCVRWAYVLRLHLMCKEHVGVIFYEQLEKPEIWEGTLLASSIYIMESHTFKFTHTYLQWVKAHLLGWHPLVWSSHGMVASYVCTMELLDWVHCHLCQDLHWRITIQCIYYVNTRSATGCRLWEPPIAIYLQGA